MGIPLTLGGNVFGAYEMYHLRPNTTIRPTSIASFLGVMVLALSILHACGTRSSNVIQPAGDSFFPLAAGNMWVFQLRPETPQTRDETVVRDTVWIDRAEVVEGRRYFLLRSSWPGFHDNYWVTRLADGDIYWTERPGGELQQFLMFSRDVHTVWSTGLPADCMDSLQMSDDYSVAETPYGRFDGVHLIGVAGGRCADFSWEVGAARGIGPVLWITGTIAGPRVRELISVEIRDEVEAPVPITLSRLLNVE